MARDLKLEVRLQAIDKATKPIRALVQGSGKLTKQLQASRDQLKALNNLQSDISSYKKQHSAVRESSEALNKAQQRLREMREQLKGMAAPSAAFQKSFLNASQAVDQLSRKHQGQRTELQKTIAKFKEAGISTATLKDREKTLGSEIDAVNQKMKTQRDRLAAIARVQERLGKAKQQYQRTQALAGSMAGVGAGGLASGSGILYAGARLLAPGIAYGAQMSELQAITRLEKDDERFKALKAQAREKGASTAFSSTEVGAGQTFLARAGFSPEAILASMGDILNLALANNTELARTADIASNISSAFKIDPEVEGNITRVADVLSGTAARANVNLEMLGETMKYMGGAEDLGMTLEQAAAMAGLLGNIGIQGSMAGTTMRAMNARITKPSKEAAKVIEKLGLQVTNASGGMRDWPEILRDINNATRKLGNVERKGMLQALFGQEAGSGTGELVSQMSEGGLDKLLDQLSNLQGENARMAQVIADNIDGDLKGLRSAWEEVGNSITDTNEGPLRDFIQTVTGVIRSIGAWINENPVLAQQILKVVAGLGLLMAAGGALTMMLASILGPIALVRYGLTVLAVAAGAVTWPVLAVIAAITALAGVAYLVYANWEPIKAFFGQTWGQIFADTMNFLGRVSRVILDWNPLGLFWTVIADLLNWLGMDVPRKFTDAGAAIVQGLIEGFKNAFPNAAAMIGDMANSIVNKFKNLLGIHSPSRVFAELGGYTMEGLRNGLSDGQRGVLAQMQATTKHLTAAGALTIGTGIAAPVMATETAQMDTRPPITARAAQKATPAPFAPQISITVNPAPGMDEQAIGRAVGKHVEQIFRQQAARQRSALYDTE
ncbi:phage tail tape measure protein [Pseudomonas sp. YY-1]|uniref:phage tail tape measure protein n=1 Tax=Pseudomonas sp. YY-1 TaxID=2058659 RepID=UPI000CBA96B4|nr:phage tail tape measure protein [Pseudomonas sp. YY-1]PKQ40640.1 phage tail tape measure protein [Pseudomonas sp. YY-1]